MGSRLVTEVGALLSTQVDPGVAGQASSKATRRLWRMAPWYITFPLFQLAPIDGSPEPTPIPAATWPGEGVKFWYRGASPAASGAGGGGGGGCTSVKRNPEGVLVASE